MNALAAYEPLGPAPWLGAVPFERTLTSGDLLAYLRSLPPAAVPRVVVLDNASLHVSKATKAARPGLAKAGIFLYYLPAYSPELNRVEAVVGGRLRGRREGGGGVGDARHPPGERAAV